MTGDRSASVHGAAGTSEDGMDRGRFAQPIRRGAEVWRLRHQEATGPNELLRHYEAVGCRLTPRWLGPSPDGGQDRYSYIEGTTGYPPYPREVRSERAVGAAAEAIRELHDASVGFLPAARNLTWAPAETGAPAEVDCIGHGDLAPWNIVFRGPEVAGIIDWDTAGPSNRVWDLAYAAFQLVPLHADAGLAAWGWDAPPDRRARLRELAAAYGLGITPADLLDAVPLRLAGMAAHMDSAVRHGDPRYSLHARDGHAAAYRAAAASVLTLDRAALA
jgi:hypothetical protein